jgi:ribosome-associated toxin RatA of RatAB toxin-antitoxin module
MAVIEMNTVINAPVGQVFSFVNDAKRHHEFVPGIVRTDVTPGNAGRVGEVWTMTYVWGPMRSKTKATVVECEENKRIVWEVSGGMMEGKEVQIYEPLEGNATRNIYRNEFRLKGLMGILGPLMVPMMKRSFRRSGDKMKRICEAEAKKSP